MPRFKVVGPCEIAGVAPGGVVELDPAKVNIDALIIGRHVEAIPDKPAKAPAKTERDDG